MLVIVLICGISFLIGGSIANRLAARGITADIKSGKTSGKGEFDEVGRAVIKSSCGYDSAVPIGIPTFCRLTGSVYVH